MSELESLLEEVRALGSDADYLRRAREALSPVLQEFRNEHLYLRNGISIRLFQSLRTLSEKGGQKHYKERLQKFPDAADCPALLITVDGKTEIVTHRAISKDGDTPRAWEDSRAIRTQIQIALSQRPDVIDALEQIAHPRDLLGIVNYSPDEIAVIVDDHPELIRFLPKSKHTQDRWNRAAAVGLALHVPEAFMTPALVEHLLQVNPIEAFFPMRMGRSLPGVPALTPEWCNEILLRSPPRLNINYPESFEAAVRRFSAQGLIWWTGVFQQNPGMIEFSTTFDPKVWSKVEEPVRSQRLRSHPGTWCLGAFTELSDDDLVEIAKTLTSGVPRAAKLFAEKGRKPPEQLLFKLFAQAKDFHPSWWTPSLALACAQTSNLETIPEQYRSEEVIETYWRRLLSMRWLPRIRTPPPPSILHLIIEAHPLEIVEWGSHLDARHNTPEVLETATKHPAAFSHLVAKGLFTGDQVRSALLKCPTLLKCVPAEHHTPALRELAVQADPSIIGSIHPNHITMRLTMIARGEAVSPPPGRQADASSQTARPRRGKQAAAPPGDVEFSF